MQLTQFSQLLDYLYQGASDKRPWHKFLSKLKAALNLQYAVIIIRPPSENDTGILYTSGGTIPRTITQTYGNDYTKYYYSVDPLNNLPLEKIVTVNDVMSRETFFDSEYYQKCLKPLGICHVAGVDFEGINNNNFNIRLTRNQEQSEFTPADLELLELLIPHIKRAVNYGIKEHHSLSEKQIYDQSLSGRSVGIVTLDEEGYILSSNNVAEKYLGEKDGVSEMHRQLQIKDPQASTEFKQRFLDIIEAQKGNKMIPSRALAVPRKSNKLEYELVLKPMPINRYIKTKGTPHLMVFIHDPEINIDISVHLIVSLYRLTVSEAMVAILLTEGKSLDEASVELDIAKNTARAHLRSIFAKVGVSKQSMLVSLISKSLASLT